MKIATLVLLCLSVSATGAGSPAAQADSSQLSTEEARFEAARKAAQDGDLESAMRAYESLVRAAPDNVDYMFGYAQTLFWLHDNEGAIAILESARTLAPAYEAVWELEYRARQDSMRGRPDPMFENFTRLARARFPDAQWHQQFENLEPAIYRWQATLVHEILDNDTPDWQRMDAGVSRLFIDGSELSLGVSRVSRFDLTDTQARLGGTWQAGEKWTFAAALALVSGPDILPKQTSEIGFTRRLGRGWAAGARYRQRDYSHSSVGALAVSGEYYFADYRLAYTVESAELESESALVNSLAFNKYLAGGARYGIVVAVGEEIELIGPGELLRTDIQSFAVTGSHPVGKSLNLGWNLATHRQGDFYRRNAIGISLFGAF